MSDKTDMLYGPRDYLRRASLPAKEMNAGFAKLRNPGKTESGRVLTQNGHFGMGLVHDGKGGIGRTQYERRRIGACTVKTYDVSGDADGLYDGRLSARAQRLARRAEKRAFLNEGAHA